MGGSYWQAEVAEVDDVGRGILRCAARSDQQRAGIEREECVEDHCAVLLKSALLPVVENGITGSDRGYRGRW